ncbi:MAG: hypothetical protein GKR89_19805 [Candidatus Latescibacteria bacterium]|nr:hypothetical protein [Candidatus Latescibacterota bacterium]
MNSDPIAFTLGAQPPRHEVRDYYLRPDILAEFSRLTYRRDVELIYHTVEDGEVHLGLGPQSAADLRRVFLQVFAPQTQLIDAYYPWLHCWSNRAYEIGEDGLRRFIGFDSGRELDFGWRRSFAGLYPGMKVLDDLGIYYRVKFSGHRSLHLCIPAEAVAAQYRCEAEGDWQRWRTAVNSVGEYVHCMGCGDALWGQMAAAEPFTGVYSVHRQRGLASVPLQPSECRRFRPWMAAVQLAAPLPGWWDMPEGATENFVRAVEDIRAGRVVIDMGAGPGAAIRGGYVEGALGRGRAIVGANTLSQVRVGGGRASVMWGALVAGVGVEIEDLRQALQDDDEDTRWFALEAWLGAAGGKPAGEGLLRRIQKLTAGGRYEREAAEEVLLESGPVGLGLLLELAGAKRQWKKDGRGPARRRREFDAVWALRQYVEAGGAAAVGLLTGLAEAGSVEVCRGVCAVLEGSGESGVAALVDLVFSRSATARREAIVALVYNGRTSLPVLQHIGAVGEQRQIIGRIIAAAQRLGRGEALCWRMRPATLAQVLLQGTAAVEGLGQVLREGDRRASYHAATGLAYMGAAAVPVLLEALQHPVALVRRRACEALRDRAVPQSRQGLQAALRDGDVGVRLCAVRGLARLGGAEPVLAALAGDPSRAVRRAVRRACVQVAEAGSAKGV